LHLLILTNIDKILNGYWVEAYILFLIVSNGWSIASRNEKVNTKSNNPPWVLFVIATAGQSTNEVWRKFIERPRSVPRKAPSFIISVKRKLIVLGLPGRTKVLTTWHADTNLSTPI
jgi:hypothetical protein